MAVTNMHGVQTDDVEAEIMRARMLLKKVQAEQQNGRLHKMASDLEQRIRILEARRDAGGKD